MTAGTAQSKITGISSSFLVRRADLDGLHAGLSFGARLIHGVTADHRDLRRGRLCFRDRALLRFDILHDIERLRERRSSGNR